MTDNPPERDSGADAALTNRTSADLDGYDAVKFVDFEAILKFFLRNRRVIAIATGVVSVVAVVMSLLLPKEYTVRVSIVPPDITTSNSGQMSVLTQLAGIGGVGGSAIAPLYPKVLSSNRVLVTALDVAFTGDTTYRKAIAQELDVDLYSPRTTEILLEAVREKIYPDVGKDGFTVIEFVWTDPDVAAGFLNATIREMDRYLRILTVAEVRERRRMIDRRRAEEADSLRIAEEEMLRFREANRAINMSPEAQLEEGRLQRNVEIHGTLYTELTRQAEIAKIEEMREMPVVNVLDWAYPPPISSGPKKMRIVFVSILLGFVLITIIQWVREEEFVRKLRKMA